MPAGELPHESCVPNLFGRVSGDSPGVREFLVVNGMAVLSLDRPFQLKNRVLAIVLVCDGTPVCATSVVEREYDILDYSPVLMRMVDAFGAMVIPSVVGIRVAMSAESHLMDGRGVEL